MVRIFKIRKDQSLTILIFFHCLGVGKKNTLILDFKLHMHLKTARITTKITDLSMWLLNRGKTMECGGGNLNTSKESKKEDKSNKKAR